MDDLNGGGTAPGLKGLAFIQVWQNRTLDEYLDRIKSAMPPDAPGRLSEREYLDVIAFLLQANSYPPGAEELRRENNSISAKIVPVK
jgi:hypothetical protein